VNEPHHPRPAGGLAALRRGEPPSAALELFYDLVFVAAVVVLSDSFSHNPGLEDLAWLSVVFAMVWIVWLQTALLFNLCSRRPDISTHDLTRVLVLAQMLLLILAAVSAADGVELHAEYVGPLFAALLVVLGAMHAFLAHREPSLAGFARRRIVGCGIGAVLFALTPLYPDPWYLVPWAIGAVVVLVPSLRPDPFAGRAVDTEHLVERFGAFTIIMLGETFVKAGLTASEGEMEGLDVVVLIGTFVIVFSIWWLYFADVPRSGPPASHRGHLAWMFVHLPLHLATVGVAVGVAKVITGEETTITPEVIPYLTVPLVIVLVCLAVLEGLSGDRGPDPVVVVILGAAALVAVVGLIGRFTDPAGLELTSLALAAIMVGAALLGRRVRPAA
jgi:low temperature requirement protein LtrA